VEEPRRSQTKLAWESGSDQPCSRRAVCTRVRSSMSAWTRSPSWSWACREAVAAAWARVLTPNGTAVLRRASATGGWATACRRVDRRGRRPWRRCAGRQGWPVAVELESFGCVGVADELLVGLVDDDEDVGGYPVEEARQLLAGGDGAGWVVRGADQDKAGPLGDGVGHGVEVVVLACGQRHGHGPGPGDLNDDRVGLEGPPGVEDFVAWAGGGLHDLLEHPDGARPGPPGAAARSPPAPARPAPPLPGTPLLPAVGVVLVTGPAR